MSLKFFGTDGIRGPYGSESLNDEIAFRAGKAAVRVVREKMGVPIPTIVVGRDTRASGKALLSAFATGVRIEGGKTIDLGIVPTPCVAFAAKESDASLACSITASHNPASDNGIKFFEGTGVKPSEELEQALDDAVGVATSQGMGNADTTLLLNGSVYRERYAQAILSFFPAKFLNGKRVALDCANGAMFEVAPMVFRELGAEVSVIAIEPDGENINASVGSEHPEAIRKLYQAGEYDLGIAFDGDGDRVVVFDNSGNQIYGEALLAVYAQDANEKGELPKETLVTTIQSNLGLDAALKSVGIKVARTDVGDKHIARLMLKEGYLLGGEESGHIVTGKFAVTGDGLVAAVSLAEIAARTGRNVASLAKIYEAFPQKTAALRVTEKKELKTCESIQSCIQKLEKELGSDGRLLVRYSGTEPKIRLLVEARTEESVELCMTELTQAVETDLEVL